MHAQASEFYSAQIDAFADPDGGWDPDGGDWMTTYLMPLGTARLWTNSTPDGVELIVRWSVPRLYVIPVEFSFEWSVLLQ